MPADFLALRWFGVNGFEINGYTLANVRLFWLEGLPGIGDFINDPTQALPPVLPSFQGRLALDFIPTGAVETINGGIPSGPFSYVFFDGLTVQPQGVPEPETYTVLAAGLALFGFLKLKANAHVTSDTISTR